MVRNPPNSGFSLLELSIVIVIISLMVGSGVMVGRTMIRSAEAVATVNRLNTIESALMAFRVTHNRLPCPADAALLYTNANFAVEAATPGACTGGTPSANYSVRDDGSWVVEGAVPVRSLNLPDEFMYDGWGRRITYAVWAPQTGVDAFTDYGLTTNCGRITVKNAGGGNRTTKGVYALLSHGENGHGGYAHNASKINGGSVNADEQVNCHCDDEAVNTGYNGVYVQKEITGDPSDSYHAFDDVVRFKERWQLQNIDDGYDPNGDLICPSGSSGSDGIMFDGTGTGSLNALAAGDVNGDNIDDIIVGSIQWNAGAGRAYVIFGKAEGYTSPYHLTDLFADGNGTTITGDTPSDAFGNAVAVGDINDDGVGDIIIGGPNIDYSNSQAGGVLVVFGHSGSWDTPVFNSATATLDVENGFFIYGDSANEHIGASVAAGDINNDGIDDILIGAPTNGNNTGRVYVVFGQPSLYSWPLRIDAGALDEDTTGFRLDGSLTQEYAGTSLAVGDVNGDTIGDIIIGAEGKYNSVTGDYPGGAYVVFGKGSGWANPIALSGLNGSNGFAVRGEQAGDELGSSVAAGDLNDDNIDDLIIGADSAGRTIGVDQYSGIVYAIYGRSSAWSSFFEVSDLNGTNGYEMWMAESSQFLGTSVAAGNFNGDTYQDMLLGAPRNSGIGDGNALVLFGADSSPPDNPTILNDGYLDGDTGFILTEAMTLGGAVTKGDFNGDGRDDMIVGAMEEGPSKVYVYFGQTLSGGWATPVDVSGF